MLFLCSLVDGPSVYLYVWVLDGDLVIPGLVFKETVYLFCGEYLCVTEILFAGVNY